MYRWKETFGWQRLLSEEQVIANLLRDKVESRKPKEVATTCHLCGEEFKKKTYLHVGFQDTDLINPKHDNDSVTLLVRPLNVNNLNNKVLWGKAIEVRYCLPCYINMSRGWLGEEPLTQMPHHCPPERYVPRYGMSFENTFDILTQKKRFAEEQTINVSELFT
jgi:hypothetical protein